MISKLFQSDFKERFSKGLGGFSKAQALLVVPKTLLENSGMDVQALRELRAELL